VGRLAQIHSINPLEPLNAEIMRRSDVVGIFPNEPAIARLVDRILTSIASAIFSARCI